MLNECSFLLALLAVTSGQQRCDDPMESWIWYLAQCISVCLWCGCTSVRPCPASPTDHSRGLPWESVLFHRLSHGKTVCLISHFHYLSTSSFILIFCLGSLLISSPCCIPLSCSNHSSTAAFSFPDYPTFPHFQSCEYDCCPLPRPALQQDWPMWPKRCPLLPEGKVVLCVVSTWTLRSVPAALQTPYPWCRTAQGRRLPVGLYPQLPSANCTEETTRTGVPASCHHINTHWHGLTVGWLSSSHKQLWGEAACVYGH